VKFRYRGREIEAQEGDTVASALFRAGVRVFSRSFKYHRQRGLMCVEGKCPNCLMTVDGEPNVRACTTPCHEGTVVAPQNAWPSIDFDILRGADRFDRMLPIGFYYKGYYQKAIWPVAEQVFRRVAGLGRIDPHRPARHDAAYYDKRFLYSDVAVVGGGPAGLAAAAAAAKTGARVCLFEENSELGGHLLYTPGPLTLEGRTASGPELAAEMAAALPSSVDRYPGAGAFGVYEGGLLGVVQGRRLIKTRYQRLIIATGTLERPHVFEGNDLPGVMLGRGARRLLHLHGIKPGKRAVVFSSQDEGLQTAAELAQGGVEVVAVVETRATLPHTPTRDQVYALGLRILSGHTVRAARGVGNLGSVEVVPLEALEGALSNVLSLNCDLLALCTGYLPQNQLLHQAGCRLDWDAVREEFVPVELAADVYAAGEAAGTHELEPVTLEGRVAGLSAARSLGRGGAEEDTVVTHAMEQLEAWAQDLPPRSGLPVTVPGPGRKKFVCWCEDITDKDLVYAIQEGFDSPELLKRYTTTTMGPCQGKLCNLNQSAICARETGQPMQSTGTTTARPPYHPVPLGVLSGRPHDPIRRTALHHRHEELGAQWLDAGEWKRPLHYGDPLAEHRAVRERVGLIDVSTLGKLLLEGPDAVKLLEKVYTSTAEDLKVGRLRYGVITDEGGIILDEGTFGRLAEDRWLVTTSTGGLEGMEQWFEWWLADTGWCCHITNLTGTLAALNLAGPKARDVLAAVGAGDVSSGALPHQALIEREVAGVPCYVLRTGFVGELAYELHYPAEYGVYLWDRLMEAGKPFGIAPFGVETQRILRLDKRHLIGGVDTDALSNPYEAGLGWAVKLEKPDFIGRAYLAVALERGKENQLVGFKVVDGQLPDEGLQVVEDGKIVGRVTSSRYSPSVGAPIGLAWVPASAAKDGNHFFIATAGRVITAEVASRPLYDPEGLRLKG
jgi:sarcosine oxidase subunit alpha